MANSSDFAHYQLPFPFYPIGSVLALAGICGNCLIIIVTLVKRYLKSASAILIGVLAIGDLFACIGYMQVGQGKNCINPKTNCLTVLHS